MFRGCKDVVEETLDVSYFRGERALKHNELHSLTGEMLATAIGTDDVEKYIGNTPGGTVAVACVNSLSSITLSGNLAALDEVASRLQKDDIFARKLKAPMAYHSHHMTHISPDHMDQLRSILALTKKAWSDAATVVSPVTGVKIPSPSTLAPEHWARNMTRPVLIGQAF